jgi:hypothetical protein
MNSDNRHTNTRTEKEIHSAYDEVGEVVCPPRESMRWEAAREEKEEEEEEEEEE